MRVLRNKDERIRAKRSDFWSPGMRHPESLLRQRVSASDLYGITLESNPPANFLDAVLCVETLNSVRRNTIFLSEKKGGGEITSDEPNAWPSIPLDIEEERKVRLAHWNHHPRYILGTNHHPSRYEGLGMEGLWPRIGRG